MDEYGTFRVVEIFTYKLSLFSFHFMLVLILCLERQVNNALPVISEVYHCSLIIL